MTEPLNDREWLARVQRAALGDHPSVAYRLRLEATTFANVNGRWDLVAGAVELMLNEPPLYDALASIDGFERARPKVRVAWITTSDHLYESDLDDVDRAPLFTMLAAGEVEFFHLSAGARRSSARSEGEWSVTVSGHGVELPARLDLQVQMPILNEAKWPREVVVGIRKVLADYATALDAVQGFASYRAVDGHSRLLQGPYGVRSGVRNGEPGWIWGYDWMVYLSPAQVEILGGRARIERDAPVVAQEWVTTNAGSSVVLQAGADPWAMYDPEVAGPWREFLVPLLPPVEGPNIAFRFSARERWPDILDVDWQEDLRTPEQRAAASEREQAERAAARPRDAGPEPARDSTDLAPDEVTARELLTELSKSAPVTHRPDYGTFDGSAWFVALEGVDDDERVRDDALSTFRRTAPSGWLAFASRGGIIACRGSRPSDALDAVGLDVEHAGRLGATLDQWHSDYGVVVDSADQDSVFVRLDRLPEDLVAFAEEVAALSPSVADAVDSLLDAVEGDLDAAADMAGAPTDPEVRALLARTDVPEGVRLLAVVLADGTLGLGP